MYIVYLRTNFGDILIEIQIFIDENIFRAFQNVIYKMLDILFYVLPKHGSYMSRICRNLIDWDKQTHSINIHRKKWLKLNTKSWN